MLKMTLSEIRGQIQLYPENWVNLTTTNCYAYALGLDINENRICVGAYQPGTISEDFSSSEFREYSSYDELVSDIERDLRFLDISYREIEPQEQIGVNEWKIALFIDGYYDEIFDFYFLRQKANGIWFHKNGFDGEPNKRDYLGNIITDPIMCILSPYKYKKCYALKLNKR